jgi:1,2-diacylglycerol 3-alpha-glucosyltransferase
VRIAFVTDTYEDGISGGVVTATRFVEALRQRHVVTVLATGAPAPDKVVLPGFQLPLHSMRENRFTFGWPSRAILEGVFAEVDVVHLNFPFLLGLRAARIVRRMGVPMVAALHVQPENLLLNVGVHSRWLTHWLYRRWVRNFFELADAVVCPSAFAVERLKLYGLSVPAWVVSNGVPAGRPRAVARPAPPAGGPYVLLCVGRLAREKRQDVVIEAVARCRHHAQIRLVIAGAGPLERGLRALATRRRLAVEFGYVSDERLNRLLAEADLFVHASEVELEGMAVLEAMAAGLPVLVANAPDSAARRFASGPDFLFRPGDPDDLAAHLDRLLDSPDVLAAGRRRSLEQAVQHDFRRSVRSLEHIYAAVIADRGARGSSAAQWTSRQRQGAS